MFRTAVKILDATIGIRSDKEEVLPPLPPGIKVESLLTDFRRVEQISFSANLNGHISIEEGKEDPCYVFQHGNAIFTGPFSRLQKKASDPRYTLWGNQGFLYRYALYLLEKKHHIFNLHACALYKEDRDTLFVIIGGAGSGKTVYLLSGLEKGLQLFSTETVHFQIEKNGIIWRMGSVVDNVRFGTLIHDFPRFLPEGKIPGLRDAWQKKIALDLSRFRTKKETLTNPKAVHILLPRIETGFDQVVWNPIEDRKKAAKSLFDNITQKLSETTVLYDELTVLGLDTIALAKARWKAVLKLIDHPSIAEISAVISDPRRCWGNILE